MTRTLCTVLFTLFAATTFAADDPRLQPAVWGAWGSDIDGGVGGGLSIPLSKIERNLRLTGGFTYFFTDFGAPTIKISYPDSNASVTAKADSTYWQIHADVVRDFGGPRASVRPYLGLGAAYEHLSAEVTATMNVDNQIDTQVAQDSDSSVALEAVAGFKLPSGKVKPFFEVAVQATNGGSRAVLRGGLRF